MKYNKRIGQNTGMSKTWKNVMKKDMMTALVQEYQNLNSGKRRAKGLIEFKKSIEDLCKHLKLWYIF